MCGIVGILGKTDVAEPLLEALRRLEYRGYDSAGIATLDKGKLDRRRASGKLRNLERKLDDSPLPGAIGIGHTRWATHGGPTENNAHPHADGTVAVVHNGIIENFRALRDELVLRGRTPRTDTDTELVSMLVNEKIEAGATPREAVKALVPRLEGAFALAFVFEHEPDLMVAARRGSPLAIGYGNGEMFLGSDAIALAPFTNRISYLEDGDLAFLTRTGVEIVDEAGNPVERPVAVSSTSALLVDKGSHRHFMAKEIAEQPEVVGHTISHYADLLAQTVQLPDMAGVDLNTLDRVTASACGTAYLAGLTGKYWFERLARLPFDIDVASEFRYREAPLPENGLALFISQSGETADTLAALRYCKANGQAIASVVNVMESTIAREADIVLPTLAGPEISVASTKGFTCQLSTILCLALGVAQARGTLSQSRIAEILAGLQSLPRLMNEVMRSENEIERIARSISTASDVLYLGRGLSYPLALEGALKLKELSYIHAEGYAAGELKHGPIALVDEKTPVIVIAPYDELFEKTVSNMQEVVARGGRVVLLTDAGGAAHAEGAAQDIIVMPKIDATLTPLLYAVPVQLLAYHAAVHMGTDVDQPRNLAKSVTVE